MAYKNLVGISCTDKTEYFCRMRDFLCARSGTYDYSTTGIGWTLIDSSYAVDEDNPAIDDWYVMYSPGESGDDDLYFQVNWSSGYLKIYGYQAWDATAHTGGNQYNTANNMTLLDTGSLKLWVYGDLDMFTIINYVGVGDYDGCTCGKLVPAYDHRTGTVATCSTTLTAGSDVSIVVDSAPTEWAVGRELFIRTTHNNNSATVEIEKFTIKTISGNTLTGDLVNSYTTGAALSDHVGYLCQGNTSWASTAYALVDAEGSTPSGSCSPIDNNSIVSSYRDPDSYEDVYGGGEFFYTSSVGSIGKMKKTILGIGDGSLVYEDILTDIDGVEYRYFKIYSNKHMAIKEV